jgi:hypothetical protein
MDSTEEKIKHPTRGRSKFVIKLLDAVASLRPAACYKYEDLEEGEIRLLCIMPGSGKDTLRCRMLQGTINKLPEFNTLSYTWDESPGDETPGSAHGNDLSKSPTISYCTISSVGPTILSPKVCGAAVGGFNMHQSAQPRRAGKASLLYATNLSVSFLGVGLAR